MHVHSLTIKNFRIFEEETIIFQPHFNLLIGPNDSGKSAIVDALRLALTTRTQERLSIDDMFDFNQPDKGISIDVEIHFADLSEAAGFAEWLTYTQLDPPNSYVLNVYCRSMKSPRGDYYYLRRKAGPTIDQATELDAGALERLQAVYLKPIRDAKLDLSASTTSRLSRILYAHTAIRDNARGIISDYSKGMVDLNARFALDGHLHADTTGAINEYFSKFHVSRHVPKAEMGLLGDGLSENAQLRAILQKFHLKTKDHRGLLGLGSTNTLYMASELMLVEDAPLGNLKLTLIEELEAHIHPMRELKIVKELQSDCKAKGVQVIATSHSPNLASQLKIQNLLLCHEGKVFDFSETSTQLGSDDYKYLERFLDVTKSSMFFARGVILVEGTTEQFQVPAFARALGYDLTDYGVTVVVVNHLAFKRFTRAFARTAKKNHIPVAVITDADAKSRNDVAALTAQDDDQDNLIRWFYGKSADEEPVRGSRQAVSTFERIILSSKGALRSMYDASYTACEGTALTEDAAAAYDQVKKLKAPVAQECSLLIDEILGAPAGKALGGETVTKESIKADIEKLFPNMRDAIVHACLAGAAPIPHPVEAVQEEMDLS